MTSKTPWPVLLACLPGIAIVAFFLLAPLAAVLVEAVGAPAAWAESLGNPLLLRALRNSVWLAACAATLSVVFGLVLAWAISQSSAQSQQRWLVVLGVPLAFSGLVVAYGFILVYGRAGFATQLVVAAGAPAPVVGGWLYSMPGLVAAYAYYLVPRAALLLLPVVQAASHSPYLAARTLGASRWQALRDVVWPELRPTLLSTWCLIAAIALGTYGTALALVGTQINILPLLLYVKVSDGSSDLAGAAVMSILLAAACCAVLALGDVLSRGNEKGSAHA